MPGLQKLALREIAQGRKINEYIKIKVYCITMLCLLGLIFEQSFVWSSFLLLVGSEHFLSMYRTIVHGRKNFLLSVAFDLGRPFIFLLIQVSSMILNFQLTVNHFLSGFALSIFMEAVLLTYLVRKFRVQLSGVSKSPRIVDCIISSSFSFNASCIRRFPVIAGGIVGAEIAGLIAIFMQLVTFINYAVSAAMTQISVYLVEAEEARKIVLTRRLTLTFLSGILVYLTGFWIVDITQEFWLGQIFNVNHKYGISVFCVSLIPVLVLMYQYLFYNGLGRESGVRKNWLVFHW